MRDYRDERCLPGFSEVFFYALAVLPPAAQTRDFLVTGDEAGFSQHAENRLAIPQFNLAKAQARGFTLQHLDKPLWRERPHFQADRSAGGFIAQHGGVGIVDRPKAVAGRGGGFLHELGTNLDQIEVEREAAQEGAIDSQFDFSI